MKEDTIEVEIIVDRIDSWYSNNVGQRFVVHGVPIMYSGGKGYQVYGDTRGILCKDCQIVNNTMLVMVTKLPNNEMAWYINYLGKIFEVYKEPVLSSCGENEYQLTTSSLTILCCDCKEVKAIPKTIPEEPTQIQLFDKLEAIEKKMAIQERKLNTISSLLNKSPKYLPDTLVKIGDIMQTKTGRKLKLCSQPINNKKKVLFLVNTDTGTIYKAKRKQNDTYVSKDLVVDYSLLTMTIEEIHANFGCFKRDRFDEIKILNERKQ